MQVKCWLKGIESDQGYQNFLFYNGYFNTKWGNATLFHQVSKISMPQEIALLLSSHTLW
jgi:hypothetical protein